MRVIVPYVTLFPETRVAVEAEIADPEYAYVGGSVTDYYWLLFNLWSEGRGFVIVEQDIVVRPGCIAELEACPEPWCGFSYRIGSGIVYALGLAKFSDDLVRSRPGVIEAIARLPSYGFEPRHWGRLDSRLAQQMADVEGLTIHRHDPPVGHLNPTNS